MTDAKSAANEGLRRFRKWLESLGMPLTLKDLGVPKEDLPDVINRCMEDHGDIVPGYMPLDRNAVSAIFSSVVE